MSNDVITKSGLSIQDVSTSIQTKAISSIAKLSTIKNQEVKNKEIADFKDFVTDISDGSINLSLYENKSGEYKVDFKPWDSYSQINVKAPGKIDCRKAADEIIRVWKSSTHKSVAKEEENNPSSTSTKSISLNSGKKWHIQDVLSMLSECFFMSQPCTKLLISLGHSFDNVLETLTNGVVIRTITEDRVIFTNSSGQSYQVNRKDKDTETMRKALVKGLEMIIAISFMDSELSSKLSLYIDPDSVKECIVTKFASPKTIPEQASTSNNTVDVDNDIESNIKTKPSNNEVINKFNEILDSSHPDVEKNVMEDGLPNNQFNMRVCGRLKKYAKDAGYEGEKSLKSLYKLLSPPNKEYINTLYETCGQKLGFVA